MLARHGSKRYNVAKNEINWLKRNYGKFLATPTVVINNRQHSYRKKAQQTFLTLLPILAVALQTLSVVISYALSVSKGDALPPPYVPFPSQVGRSSPGSFVFALGFSTSSFFTLSIVYLRWKQVALIYAGHLNNIGITLGVMMAFSIFTLVAANQLQNRMSAIVYGIHTFICVVFCFVHVILTRKTPTISGKYLWYTRVILVEFILVFSVVFAVFHHPSLLDRNHPPYSIAQVSYWLFFSCFQLFQLTFFSDMRQIYFAFDVWIVPNHQSQPDSHLLERIQEEDEGTIITTTDTNDNEEEFCMFKTQV